MARLAPEEQIAALLQESLSVAHWSGTIETKDPERVVSGTTVQEKAVAHPTDARLTHRAIEKLLDLPNARVSNCARAICGCSQMHVTAMTGYERTVAARRSTLVSWNSNA